MKLSISALKFLLIAVSVASVILVFFLKPIPQDESFHHFADIRRVFDIPNCLNVISNAAFLWVGCTALQKLQHNKLTIIAAMRPACYIFFAGILLVAFGSAWYHFNPNNTTLVWDRLPMTIAFMSLLSIALAEFVSVDAGRRGLVPFLFAGLLSIAWWQYGEMHHNGDLRLYALVQFLPVVLLALMLLFGTSRFNAVSGYWALFTAYIIAKLAEHFDGAIYHLTQYAISGHSIKHMITAIGLWFFLVYLQERQVVVSETT